jgi:phospholipid/cholesterol/gamma-HCH transport system substrate-binding protein
MIAQDEKRRRYLNRAVGFFVIATAGLALAAFVQSGRIERWFNPLQPVKVILPQRGLHGLSAGAKVEILGTDAGEVEEIVIEPDQQIHARVLIRRDMRPFVRQDSTAFIRKRFGVAGDSYLDITRGTGQPMDWDYAVLDAQVDRSATDMLQRTLTDLRDEALPLLKQTRKAVQTYGTLGQQLTDPQGEVQTTLRSITQVASKLRTKQGLAGRLINDPNLANETQALFKRLNRRLNELEPVLRDLKGTAKNMRNFSDTLDRQSGELPKVSQKVRANLNELQKILKDLSQTSPRLPQVADQLEQTTSQMPALTVQVQSTLLQIEKLVASLRSSWLIGGGDDRSQPRQLTPEEASP